MLQTVGEIHESKAKPGQRRYKDEERKTEQDWASPLTFK